MSTNPPDKLSEAEYDRLKLAMIHARETGDDGAIESATEAFMEFAVKHRHVNEPPADLCQDSVGDVAKAFDPSEKRDEGGKWIATGAAAPPPHKPNTGVKKGSLVQIPISKIDFPGGLSDTVAPIHDNRDEPLIVKKQGDNYSIIDGFGRASGLKNAGKSLAHAIIVSDTDIAKNTSGQGDDPEWVAAMHWKYAKHSNLAESPRVAATRKEKWQKRYGAVDELDGWGLKAKAIHQLGKMPPPEDQKLLEDDDPATVQKYRTAIKRDMLRTDLHQGIPVPPDVAKEFPADVAEVGAFKAKPV